MDATDDFQAAIDAQTWRIVECNDALAQATGYSREELIGRSVLELYAPMDPEVGHASLATLRSLGYIHDAERELVCKDGSRIFTRMDALAFCDGTGEVVQVQVSWRDITARKQAERDQGMLLALSDILRSSTAADEVLAHAGQFFADYLRAPRCFIAELARPFNRVTAEASRSGATIVISDAEADPRTAAVYALAFAPDHLRALISVPTMREKAWASSFIVASDTPRVWSDREVRLARLVAERVWLWIEHLRVIERVREEPFRLLVDGVKDHAIFMLTPDGRVASWNAGAERLTGYRESEVLGRDFRLFYTDEDCERAHPAQELERAERDGRYEEEGWRVRKDGSRYWSNVVITALRDDQGGLRGFAKVTRDFSERRRVEEQLAASLREREVLLQEIHHRVKNNLQVISSLINMQARQVSDPAARNALDECKMRVGSIALIHEKLYQSRDYAHVSFSEYVQSLAMRIFHATGTSAARIRLRLDVADVALGVDKAIPCGLIVNELITNALKHAFPNDRRGELSVSLERCDGACVLSVRDDGVGLPEGFQVNGTVSLGMQLIGTLVHQVGGELSVSSAGGACFSIRFSGLEAA